MLHNELPAQIQPEVLCQTAPIEGMRLSGKILLRQLANLSDEFKGQEDTPVSVSLIFSKDKEGYCCIDGEISVELQRQCQRCLQPMAQKIQSAICVSPVVNDKAATQLPPQYEPLLVNKGSISVAEWIAEELHLALPFVPRHDIQCVI